MPSLSSVLSCPICSQEFQAKGKMQPLSLICGHSFCIGESTQDCTYAQSLEWWFHRLFTEELYSVWGWDCEDLLFPLQQGQQFNNRKWSLVPKPCNDSGDWYWCGAQVQELVWHSSAWEKLLLLWWLHSGVYILCLPRWPLQPQVPARGQCQATDGQWLAEVQMASDKCHFRTGTKATLEERWTSVATVSASWCCQGCGGLLHWAITSTDEAEGLAAGGA